MLHAKNDFRITAEIPARTNPIIHFIIFCSAFISARSFSIRLISLLVASEVSKTSDKDSFCASERASAYGSLKPAAFSLLMNLCVSNVMVAIT